MNNSPVKLLDKVRQYSESDSKGSKSVCSRQARRVSYFETLCRVPNYAEFIGSVDVIQRKLNKLSTPRYIFTRHNHKFLRNNKSSSSGRYRPGGTSNGVVLAMAFSFIWRSAWTYTSTVSRVS